MAVGMGVATGTAITDVEITGLGGDCGGPGNSGCLSHAPTASTSATPNIPRRGFLQAVDNFQNGLRFRLMIACLLS